MRDMLPPTTNIEQSARKAKRHRCQTSDIRTVTQTTSQQTPVAVRGEAIPPPPLFSIKIEETIFNKLTEISTRENIPLRELASELLKYMLVQHSRELRHVIETIKKRAFR